MKLFSSVVGVLLDKVAPEVASYYKEKQEQEHLIEMAKLKGKQAWEIAKTQRAAQSEGRDHEWELESIRNSGWKDEWVLVVLSIPLILVFIPYTQDTILQGFIALESTPDWFKWLVMAIYAATFGLRLWRRKM